ncbi:carbon-nitrogen hydrolase family protein [Falsiroseomonas sp. CW058]|uniref:carbon-nitrogen hydrolase family protein n=1 Tax=Falsiroseomonas sp. CW058 TaxID=3388664 RepID=UPI003D312A08
MTSRRTLTVAAAQTGPVLDPDDMRPGVEAACAMVERAATQGVEVICFSELFLTPFFPNRLEARFDHWFLTLPDPRVQPLLDAAKRHRMAMIFPFGERDGRQYFNSAAVIGRDGRILGTYRKTHIPAIFPSNLQGGTGSYEKFYFTPGSSLPVFEIDGVKVGVQICYDRKFPEGSRALAIGGAEVLFMPICAATYGEMKLRDHTWDLPLRARAYENGTFVVAVNRAGDEAGRRHIGRSMIISPIGAEIMAEAGEDEPELLVATLDLDEVGVAQKSLPWWRDRRPELYGALQGS